MTQLYLAAESHGLPLSGKQKSTIGNKLIYSFRKKGGGEPSHTHSFPYDLLVL